MEIHVPHGSLDTTYQIVKNLLHININATVAIHTPQRLNEWDQSAGFRAPLELSVYFPWMNHLFIIIIQ